MATVTPRKRNRSSMDTDGASLAFETPVKKLMVDFAEDLSPLRKARNNWCASQITRSSSSSDECEENEAVPTKSPLSRKLDNSPLQTASIPTIARREFSNSKLSPKTAASYKSIVPVVSFYSKEKRYLTPLERKQLNANWSFGERKNDENLLVASRTEKTDVNFSSNISSRPAKHTVNSKHGKAVPKKLKKAKADIPPSKPSVEKENAVCLIKKKMDSPFRVLSMRVKPALKLQSGAAFFSARKKSHSGSKKLPVDSKSPQGLPGSPPGNDQPRLLAADQSNSADTKKPLEASGILRSISVPQKKEKETGGEFTSLKNQEKGAVCEGKMSLQKSESTSVTPFSTSKSPALEDADAENAEFDEIGSSTACESDDQEIIPSSQSPCEGNKKVSSSTAVVYPIFNASSASKKRTRANLDESATPGGSNPPAKMAHGLQKNKKTKELCKRSKDQMIIDAGQKHFGAVVCKSCGMIYTAASPEDEAQHIQHHERFLEGLRYVGWKKERVVAEFWDGKIVLILPDDPKYAVKKAEDVREIVDNELGFKQVTLNCPAKTKMYLFVSNEKMIVGCLVAESIKQAFRVLSEPGAAQSPGQDALQHQRAWRCSAKPEPAICGVSRVWVFSLMRRKGIARRMVDVVRTTFMYGCYLSTDEIAFSDPTPDGKLFATKYCQTPNFLVYNFVCYNQVKSVSVS
nr:PREDICTED: N-acetyltransferase ESCO2 isoform X1 [Apteryx mantelli mantelli]XP_013800550.1 PREDICTED: N-acetyltransferase ESCO2 isoform X1 [Apteryx mantelli mantelli]XP_013800557.1 PREDICTED: N-acetyltransferase ESCO2 isoform X2 [Apteryx mantelli mantelli]